MKNFNLNIKNVLQFFNREDVTDIDKEVESEDSDHEGDGECDKDPKKHDHVEIIEIDYLVNTPIIISKDIYDLTVGANYTGVLTPLEKSYSFR